MVMRMPEASSLVAPTRSVRGQFSRGRALLALPLLAILASCGPKASETPIANIPVPLPVNVPYIEVPPPPPALIGKNKGEDLWHLRSGLNVAVLLCQGPDNPALVASYNKMLSVHKPLLSEAAQYEIDIYRAAGGKKWQDSYDDHMTKVYNAYSGTLTRDSYCSQSKTILAEVEGATTQAFNDKATYLLWELNKAAGMPDPDGELARAAMAPPLPAMTSASTAMSATTP